MCSSDLARQLGARGVDGLSLHPRVVGRRRGSARHRERDRPAAAARDGAGFRLQPGAIRAARSAARAAHRRDSRAQGRGARPRAGQRGAPRGARRRQAAAGAGCGATAASAASRWKAARTRRARTCRRRPARRRVRASRRRSSRIAPSRFSLRDGSPKGLPHTPALTRAVRLHVAAVVDVRGDVMPRVDLLEDRVQPRVVRLEIVGRLQPRLAVEPLVVRPEPPCRTDRGQAPPAAR